ncbi:MAG: hypothetical protein HY763_00455 [Planctomycetes bacterium]|nr:hypothetical protein [Planctomycetota bacterium]
MTACYVRLTTGEKEVFRLVVAELAKKTMASRLHISQWTIEVHRAHVMREMRGDSVAALVHVHLRVPGARPDAFSHVASRRSSVDHPRVILTCPPEADPAVMKV